MRIGEKKEKSYKIIYSTEINYLESYQQTIKLITDTGSLEYLVIINTIKDIAK